MISLTRLSSLGRLQRHLALATLALIVCAAGLTSRRALADAQPEAKPETKADAPAQKQPEAKPAAKPEAKPEGREGGAGAGGGGGGAGRREGPSVEGAMKGMNRALERLKGQIADAAKKEENLRLINDMQRNCVTAKGLPVPGDLLERAKDDAAKTKLKATYRAELLHLLRALIEIEQAIIDDKTEVAVKGVGELGKLEESGHNAVGLNGEGKGDGVFKGFKP